MPPTIDEVRAQFPALASGFAYFENAGGSQVPQQVIDRMCDLMVRGYVQTGAGYPGSDHVDETVAAAKAYANTMMNGEGIGLTVVGPSTTNLLYRLSQSIEHLIVPGDEIVIGVSNHEANIGPWVRWEERGARIVWWQVDPESGDYDYEELSQLISEKTKLVAVAHTSNILGDILDVARVTKMARDAGALSIVDGVAFAPHAAIDVKALGADFYVCSMYKVFGPHIALLFGRKDAWELVRGPNHFFIANKDLPWKFELGCQPYEALAGLLGVGEYFSFVAGREKPQFDRITVEDAYDSIQEMERPLLTRIGRYLSDQPRYWLVGHRLADQDKRHPTFSFLVTGSPSDAFVRKVNGPDIGVRFGHMYAARLCERLGVPLDSGFVRISAVHYNSVEDCERLIKALENAL